MRIAVLGATGRIGRVVVDRALADGHEVVALARHPRGLRHERLVEHPVDVFDPDTLSVLDGADAVVFAVGKPGRSTTVVRSTGMANVVAAADAYGIKRVVAVSPSAVEIGRGATLARKAALKFFWHKLNRNPLLDVERMEDELHHSDLDWIVVRTTRLRDRVGGRYRVVQGTVRGPERPMALADLAEYVVSHLDDGELHRAVVTLTGQR
ncbi:NAD(P)-dependent oxidoreductase [Actinokineospora enzanensis]|uniref:NAD(P)-dependent oxidoreductase n=1 Tax=Actinokineospora enzanensis TaxID=155975 RepID=UPI0003710D92|nr:NAD(P)-binding oxidoreductase [Actinokineospora enzanensis]